MSPTINNYENPDKFNQKLESLKRQLPPILDDYNTYYVLYNKNPDYNEYQQTFNRIQGNLNQLNSELFMLSNNVQSETDKINTYLSRLNTFITLEKTKRTDLKKKLGNIESDNNATTEMIINYKEMYNNDYLRNWGLLLSIVLAGFAISKVYSSKQVIPIPLK
jgi:hypothetical protein